MLKNKKIIILSLVILLLISASIVGFGSTFIPKYNDNIKQANSITTVYEDSKIDFVVPSPSEQQVQEMKQNI